MAEAIDTAFVDIRPDFSGFAIETERGIKRQLAGVNAAVGVDSRGLRRAQGDIAATSTGLAGLRKNAGGATSSMALLGSTAARTGAIAGAGIAGIGIAAAIGIGAATKASIDFETAFSGVRKTVSATRPELEGIRKDILDLSQEIPVSAVELANIGESAGQLGIKTSAIGSFTKVVAELGVTTNLTSEQAADAFARIANITQLPQDKFDEMGSTVVALGNKLAATESEITDFGLRIAGAGHQVGLTQPEILSIGAALSSVGLEAEAGGTAISTTLVKLASAVAGGGAKLKAFAAVAGESSDEFAKQFKEKPAAALVAFVKGLGTVKKEGGNVFATLEKLGLGGIRVRDALLRSAGAGDLLARSIKIGDQAWKQDTALQKEASIRFETTASKIQLLRNQVTALAIDVGDKLGPSIGEGAERLGDGIKSLRSSEGVSRALSDGFKNLRAAVDPLIAVFERRGHILKDTFSNFAESVRISIVVLKPVAIVVGAVLVAAFESLFFALDKVNKISRLFGDFIKKSVSIAVKAIDLFLAAVGFMVSAIDAIPGVDMSGTKSAIDDARNSLHGFVDDLNNVDHKTVNVKVELELPTQELFTFQGQLAALQGQTTGPDEGSGPSGARPAFGQPGFKPLPSPTKPAKGGKKGNEVDLGPPLANVPKAIQAKEQRLQDQVSLAQALDESTANDRAALGVLANFYDEQARNEKLAVALRRGFSVKAAQARQAINQIQQQDAADAQTDAEARARNEVAAADATENNLKDDIATRKHLVAVLKGQVALARQTGQGVASAQSAVDDAERDLLRSINERKEHKIDIKVETAKNAVTIADSTETNLRDDIKSRQTLVAALKARVKVVRATHGDVAAATSDLRTAQRNLGDKIKEVNKERSDLALDAIKDNQTLASFTKGLADDRRWLNAEKRFWQHKVATLKKGSVERRKARVELERTKKEIRDLNDTTADANKGTTIVGLLTQNAQSLSQFGSNIGNAGIDPLSGFDMNASLVAMLSRQRGGDPAAGIRPDNPLGDFSPAVDRLVEALDRNTQATKGGNASAGDVVIPVNHGPIGPGVGRGSLASRFWDAQRARRIEEESTSG